MVSVPRGWRRWLRVTGDLNEAGPVPSERYNTTRTRFEQQLRWGTRPAANDLALVNAQVRAQTPQRAEQDSADLESFARIGSGETSDRLGSERSGHRRLPAGEDIDGGVE